MSEVIRVDTDREDGIMGDKNPKKPPKQKATKKK
jgi:hypothetical protein